MQKLSGRKLLLIGFTLFSMFFGAGNLIFPPDLGAKAGIHFWPAFLGLAISAVGLPVAGVVAVARAQGLEKLAGRVHPVFAQVFMILIYLSIGPCLAIPRTASTSFAMLAPLVGTGAGLQLGYSVVFFAAAFLVALQPEDARPADAGAVIEKQVVPHALPVLPQQGVGVRQVFHDAGVRSPGKKFHALAFQPAAQARVRAAHRNVKDHRIPPLQTRPCILRGAGV